MADSMLSKDDLFKALDEYYKIKGIHTDAVDCPFSQADIQFIKQFKTNFDKAVFTVGMTVVLAIVGVVGLVIKLGIESWRTGGGQ